jgi:(heptosyl)LPS beta-1,4-glucosyltransferase
VNPQSKIQNPKSEITAVVIARDEAKHIAACLASVRHLTDDLLVLLDDRTGDDTARLAEAAGARVVVSHFVNFSAQRNRALEAAGGEWVLFLDADERLTPALIAEIQQRLAALPPPPPPPLGEGDIVGYWIARRNYMFGHWVRHAGWYPDYQLRLLRRAAARYDESREVHERAQLSGTDAKLREPLIHYNYETWAQFRAKQRYYTAFEARVLYQQGQRAKLRNFLLQPLREFRRRYISLEGWKDGWLGLALSLAMGWYEFRKYAIMRRMSKLLGACKAATFSL